MDRPTPRTAADARGPKPGPDQALVLPSRRSALDLCRPQTGAGPVELPGEGHAIGPVLVTGDAGVGKTWLWKRLESESPPGRRWIAVDVTPADEPADFYRLLAHELGLVDPGGRTPAAASRVGLVDVLAARQADGERVGLVVEEAHNLSGDLWEEVRVLANRLGQPGGFASMLLAGQTSLALRFASRPFAAIEARLAARVHLGPIGVDEAGDLLARYRPGREWPEDEVERLHRDAWGNPRRLLRLAAPAVDRGPGGPAALPSRRASLPEPDREPEPAPAPSPAAASMPLTGPARPPIRVEDNMIEVGWSPEAATAGDEATGPGEGSPAPAAANAAGEEAVRDHYAAIQAWREWAENQARKGPRPAVPEDDEADEVEEDDLAPAPGRQPLADRPTVRAEGEQKFAPFGHLFSKMAQAREPE